MTEPITAITAGVILSLAFQEFSKVAAGEVAKKTIGGALDLARALREKITAKFKGNVKAEAAIEDVQANYSPSALNKLEVYLDDAMADDSAFATDLRQAAQQIINIQNQSTVKREYKNYGRDQINIERIDGNARIGGS